MTLPSRSLPLLLCAVAALVSLAVSCADPAPENNGAVSPTLSAGDEGGSCYGNDTCNYGLFCGAQDLCEIIPGPSSGERGGACLPNGGCDVGLACRSGNICLPDNGQNSPTALGDEAPIEVDEIIVGEVDWEDITCDPNASGPARWACSVGYLSINSRSRCTAWLVSPNVIATNNHCISEQAEIQEVIATFNFEKGVDRTDFDSFICEDFLATSPELDLTLIGCTPKNNETPGSRYGWFEIDFDTPIRDEDAIVVIHQNCIQGPLGCADTTERPDKKLSEGRVLLAENSPTSFRHSADTLGGSSGSPVIDANTGKVRGIHFAGVKSQGYNIATSAERFSDWRAICDILNPGNCDGRPDMNPGDPKIEFRTFDAFVNEPFVYFIKSGSDPNAAEDVQVRCSSPGSNFPDNAPFTSPWGAGGTSIETSIIWPEPGFKDLRCTTVERDGDQSTTIAVNVNVLVDGGGGGGEDNPPTTPSSTVISANPTVNVPVIVSIQGGVDPDGRENVQTKCSSEGSNWTADAPFSSRASLSAQNVTIDFTWTTPGPKVIECFTTEIDGNSSPVSGTPLNVSSGSTTTDNPPSTPNINAPASTTISTATIINITGGVDPEGQEAVQIQCESEESNWVPGNPFASELIPGPHNVDASFQWSSPGPKTILCVAVEEDGQISEFAEATIVVNLDSTADAPPSAPTSIAVPPTITVGEEAALLVTVGTDPDGTEQVRVVCDSENSTYTISNPFTSALVPSGSVITMPITWTSAGPQTVFCKTQESDGDESAFATFSLNVRESQVGADSSPTQPAISAPATASVGQAVPVDILVGVDQEGAEQVRVQCISSGSNWTSGNEFNSAFSDGGNTVTTSFVWDTPGSKSIFCSTVEFDGDASSSEIVTIMVQ